MRGLLMAGTLVALAACSNSASSAANADNDAAASASTAPAATSPVAKTARPPTTAPACTRRIARVVIKPTAPVSPAPSAAGKQRGRHRRSENRHSYREVRTAWQDSGRAANVQRDDAGVGSSPPTDKSRP